MLEMMLGYPSNLFCLESLSGYFNEELLEAEAHLSLELQVPVPDGWKYDDVKSFQPDALPISKFAVGLNIVSFDFQGGIRNIAALLKKQDTQPFIQLC